MDSGEMGMRKVLLGRVWTKMGLLEKMGLERDISEEIRDLWPNWALWEKWVSERDY